jgi:anti-anti-sigma factor
VLPLAIRITRSSGWCRVTVEGELDLASAPTLELELDRLEWRPPRLLLVDLRGLTFMDVAGIRVLLAAHERAERRGHELAIVRGAPIVERLIQLLGLDSVLDLIDDPPRCLRSVAWRRRVGLERGVRLRDLNRSRARRLRGCRQAAAR